MFEQSSNLLMVSKGGFNGGAVHNVNTKARPSQIGNNQPAWHSNQVIQARLGIYCLGYLII